MASVPEATSTPTMPTRVLTWARSVPVTLIVAAAVLIAGVATGALWQSAEESGLIDTWGWGEQALEEGRWWTIFTGMLIAPTPWMYALILLVFVTGAGYLERHYGAVRMLVVTLGTHIAAVLIVAGVFWLLRDAGLHWVDALSQVPDVGLSNAGFGALGAATAAMPVLWRRRVRLFGSIYVVMMIMWAAEIWDFTHAAAFFVGLAVGPWAVGRAFEKWSLEYGTQEVRDTVALLLTVNGLHTLLNHVWPGEGGVLAFGHPDVPTATLLSDLGLAILGFLFAYAAHRGSRFAWWWTTPVALISALAGTFVIIVDGLTPSLVFATMVEWALVVLLVAGRRHFRVSGAQGVRSKIFLRVGLAAIVTLIFTTGIIMAMDGSFDSEPTLQEAVTTSLVRMMGDSPAGLQPATRGATVLLGTVSVIWWAIIAISVAGVLLTTRRPADDARAREQFIALQTAGTTMTSVGYMARWPGIHHWKSDDNLAAWGYTVSLGTAVVLGDPAGERDAVVANAEGFEEFCRARGWRVAYFAASPELTVALAGSGWKGIQVAQDTVIDLPELEFKGKSWQDVRSAVNRANREGITMKSFHLAGAPRGLRDQLEAIEAQWTADKSLPEMKFTLGTLEEALDPNVLMHVAVDEDGTVHGMTSWMPVYRDGAVAGWTIDIMKRRLDDDAMKGVMEFLIAASAMQFKDDGYTFISLSCAPLAYGDEVDSSIERLLDTLADKMEPYYGFASLERFKEKFKPRHTPMSLLYRDEAKLPAIALSIGRAYLPDATAADLVKAAVKRD
ncbi:phosphatidylglycerol lysyltransferase domain-containing protein [Demequina globuliformis]|uniref:phosphatidylglycerol lysyltransferase domain-containing protein n=1 Tax=Demequina globuliformis TaxID=676202 RepID=UPI000A065792|nr:phosphatidylglycerol lysyltransferase domain-containing protein [Demequina globuliformis]